MLDSSSQQFAQIIGPLAKHFFGDPNPALSSATELRFGSRGSLSVDLVKGTWFDHEANGGGGVLDLVEREQKLTGKEAIDWLREKGFINGSGPQPKSKSKQKFNIAKSYPYYDEDCILLFEVCRLDPKDFRQRRKPQPDDPPEKIKNGWVWSTKDVRQVPYGLPELKERLSRRVVYIVEGEKDCERLWDLGVLATTNAGGAGKFDDELVPFFEGADVVLIPDYDPQVRHKKTGEPQFHPDGRPVLPGQDHMQAVAAKLHPVAKRIRVLELWRSWPAMPLKGDTSDWIENAKTTTPEGEIADALDELADAVPDWKPDEKQAAEPESGVNLEDFFAYMPMHVFIFAPTGDFWIGRSVNARLPPVLLTDSHGQPVLDEYGKPQFQSATDWLDKNQPVEQVTWAPGEPELIKDRLVNAGGWIERLDCSVFNLYMPPTLVPGDASKAGRWIDHVRKVYPNDADHIIKWLAQRVQKPQIKINHGIVMGGAMGIGKDTIMEPVKRAVGPWNVKEVSPSMIVGRFTSHLKSVILRVSEARDTGDVDRYKLYDHMKAIMAAPPDVLRVDEKNIKEHEIFNVTGVIITTNHKSNGIYLPADDRRHFVAWSDLTKEDFIDPGPNPNKYWDDLWAWFDAGGDRDVAAYLLGLDISSFNPKAPPPKTPAFWAIADANMAPEESELADALDQIGLLESGKAGFPKVVTLYKIGQNVTSSGFKDWLEDRNNRRKIPHRMESCGYVPVRNPDTKDGLWSINSVRQVIYAKKELSVRDAIAAAQVYRW